MTFFEKSAVMTSASEQIGRVPACAACKLHKSCHTPKMKVYGKGKSGILIVGRAPSEQDDQLGKPATGEGGKILRDELARNQLSLFDDCWFTHAAICKPKILAKDFGKIINWCRPNLVNTIHDLQPKVVILLGMEAIQSLIPYIWRADGDYSEERWKGWNIPSQKINAWVCPTFNPTFLAETEGRFRNIVEINKKQFREHIKQAVLKSQQDRLNYSHTQNDPDQIVDIVETVPEIIQYFDKVLQECGDSSNKNEFSGRMAFDFETSCLKPDSKNSRILSMSVSNGITTFAFPWSLIVTGTDSDRIRARKAVVRFLRSPYPKIAANLKFEERWVRSKLGIRVRNWKWDTVLAAHWLDYREGITSLKFQSFVQMGYPDFEHKVSKFMDNDDKSGYAPNQLQKNVRLHDLLIYNGMDSYLEFQLAKLQIQQYLKSKT